MEFCYEQELKPTRRGYPEKQFWRMACTPGEAQLHSPKRTLLAIFIAAGVAGAACALIAWLVRAGIMTAYNAFPAFVISILVAAITLILYLQSPAVDMRIFDFVAGEFYIARSRKSKKRKLTRLADVVALQIIKKNYSHEHSADLPCVYELDLVLSSGKRLWVLDCGSQHFAEKFAGVYQSYISAIRVETGRAIIRQSQKGKSDILPVPKGADGAPMIYLPLRQGILQGADWKPPQYASGTIILAPNNRLLYPSIAVLAPSWAMIIFIFSVAMFYLSMIAWMFMLGLTSILSLLTFAIIKSAPPRRVFQLDSGHIKIWRRIIRFDEIRDIQVVEYEFYDAPFYELDLLLKQGKRVYIGDWNDIREILKIVEAVQTRAPDVSVVFATSSKKKVNRKGRLI